MFFIGTIVGTVIGATLGIFLIAILNANKDEEIRAEQEEMCLREKRTEHNSETEEK